MEDSRTSSAKERASQTSRISEGSSMKMFQTLPSLNFVAESSNHSRQRILKMAASMFAAMNLRGTIPSAFGMSFGSGGGLSAEDQSDMNKRESVTPSCLMRQVGFQLAHEQFTVPQLVELGIAADHAEFDLRCDGRSHPFRPARSEKSDQLLGQGSPAAFGQNHGKGRIGWAI
jgi:hypothetical protein